MLRISQMWHAVDVTNEICLEFMGNKTCLEEMWGTVFFHSDLHIQRYTRTHKETQFSTSPFRNMVRYVLRIWRVRLAGSVTCWEYDAWDMWQRPRTWSHNVFTVTFQQQHLIELMREKKIEEALDFAQTHLAERGEENREILSELEHTLALLAFENPELSPFGELLHPSQRQKVSVSSKL